MKKWQREGGKRENHKETKSSGVKTWAQPFPTCGGAKSGVKEGTLKQGGGPKKKRTLLGGKQPIRGG